MDVAKIDTFSAETSSMSQRGFANVASILPKISAQIGERTSKSAPKIDLSTSENCLLRPELIQIYEKAITEHLESKHLSYPQGFSGEPLLLSTLANFLNTYFHPVVPVEPAHIVTAPGAATSLDTLLFNICDPGDAVLVPGPYWNGFDFQFRVRSSVEPILVNVESFEETFTSSLIPALKSALTDSTRPVRALVLTNPHNPFGQSYPKEVLKQCIKFCHENKIHYISDEVYALSSFPNASMKNAPSFVSALTIDVVALGCDLQLVHTIWSLSKDFGSSGIRMGCIVTQNNNPLAVGAALGANTQTSSFSAIATIGLLSSPNLPTLLDLNSERLAAAYNTITTFLIRRHIQFIPVTSGLFVFARVHPTARTWDDEAEFVARIRSAGVLVSAGRAYHVVENEKGWIRITFAVDSHELSQALRALEKIL